MVGVENEPVGVLVVEDEILLRTVVADALVRQGYRVLEARDAQEALILLEARTDLRIMFTDYAMPGDLNGLSLAHVVRRHWPRIGIIVTSGKISPDPCHLPAGARFLPKPYVYSAVMRIVADLLPPETTSPHADAGNAGGNVQASR